MLLKSAEENCDMNYEGKGEGREREREGMRERERERERDGSMWEFALLFFVSTHFALCH